MTQSTIILEAIWPWHSWAKTAKLMPRCQLSRRAPAHQRGQSLGPAVSQARLCRSAAAYYTGTHRQCL